MDENIQSPEVVEGATTEPQAETAKEPKPLTLEDIEKIVSSKVEDAKRHFQSIADRDIKAARLEAKDYKKRAELAEMKVQEINRLAAVKPEITQLMSRAAVETEARAFRERESYDRLQQIREEFNNQMVETVKDFDIDPTDPRLDYAIDVDIPGVRNKRLMASISKIQKEERTKAEIAKKSSQDAELRAKQKEELENNVIDKTTPSPYVKGIPTDINKFRAWVANLSQDEFEKLAPEINKMRREGKIK